MKLTEDQILLGYDEVAFEGFRNIICQCETKEQSQQLKTQILENQEKAEKWDLSQIHETRAAPEKKRPTLREQELEQENKQLKEIVERLKRFRDDWAICLDDFIEELKEILYGRQS